ncbi:MAG: hypothetical protein C5B53_01385 [Candidatus Melainabacteria bacterium]|nr:MAG: hypothetical protein C5B53_01385 [Candidatus Melainabacteria bacterium]
MHRPGPGPCPTPTANVIKSTIMRSKIINPRRCVACRKEGAQKEMIRLTVDHRSNEVHFNQTSKGPKAKLHGRSAYLCRAQECLTATLKGTRLKYALEGRRAKGVPGKRLIQWPLEPQLMKLIASKCTEP